MGIYVYIYICDYICVCVLLKAIACYLVVSKAPSSVQPHYAWAWGKFSKSRAAVSAVGRRVVPGGISDALLVGGLKASEKYESVGMIIPNIWENKIHVPNHQPVWCGF